MNDERKFTEEEHRSLVMWAKFLLDAQAAKRFSKKVSLWGAIVLGFWSLSNLDQVSIWFLGVWK